MTPTSRKKAAKPSPTHGRPIALPASLATLLSKLSVVAQSFSADHTPDALLPRLASALEAADTFETHLRASTPADATLTLPRAWQEDLDREGVGLWNRSTAIRCTSNTSDAQDDGIDQDSRTAVAELRRLGFLLVSLGAVQPLTPETRLSLLSLATKAALAANAAGHTATTTSLLEIAAPHAEYVQQSATGASEVKALLEFWAARTRASLRAKNFGIMSWIMGKTFAEALVERLAGSSNVLSRPAIGKGAKLNGEDALVFAGQISLAASFLILGGDRRKLEALFNTLESGQLQLETSAAFVCTTYIWKKGDSCHLSKNFVDAAQWYLLGAHPVMQGMDRTTWPKSLRKAALCYSEVKMYDEAEDVMRRGIEAGCGDIARSHFVRYYNFVLKGDESCATAALKSLMESPDFTLDILLWASKTARESGSKQLLTSVLNITLGMCTSNPRHANSVDLLVLIRTESGLLLLNHFQTSFDLAKSISQQGMPPLNLRKSIAWLSKTGYNICIRFGSEWSPETLNSMFTTSASIMDLETQLANQRDPETISRLWLLRFAALLTQVSSARNKEYKDRIEAYHELLSPVRDLRDALLDALRKFPTLPRGDDIEASLIGIELEVLVGVQDWAGVSDLVNTFSTSEQSLPVELIKSAAKHATSNASCPPSVTIAILKRTLDVLRGLASWFRLVITYLLKTGAGKEAFQYITNVLETLKYRRASYPSDEINFLVYEAWDYGIKKVGDDLEKLIEETFVAGVGLFTSASPSEGRKWCQSAIDLAKLGEPGLISKVGTIELKFSLAGYSTP
ncbi:hypothetical protein P7C70_g373, partial [Phenoliferia sp. Uapishka_3]